MGNKMKKERGLTPTQEKVFDFLKGYLAGKLFPPTLREIASHFGLRGPKGPQKTLNILERKGYIRKVPGVSRAIEILGRKVGRYRSLPYKMGFVESAIVSTFPIPIVGRVQAGEPFSPSRISKVTSTSIGVLPHQEMFSFFVSKGTA